MMKKLFLLVLATLLILFIYQKNPGFLNIDKYLYQSSCDNPIGYRLGYLDTRFNITESEFLNDVRQVNDIWSFEVKKNLFNYDPSGSLIINLVYDQRQALSNEINQQENTLKNQKDQINPELAQYEKDVSDFNQRMNNLNDEIQSWNRKGGAPPEVYSQLVQEQQALQTEAARLNATADRLNQTTSQFNADVLQLNKTVNDLNQTLAKKPEEGLYDRQKNEIYIYFITDQNELIHTLAHEMGHALGLGHASNKDSIMYPYVTKTVAPSEEDIKALQQLCEKKNIIEIYLKKLQTDLKY